MFFFFRETFGLCVKGTIFPRTQELHIAEWMQTNLDLGASKIIIYIIYVSPLMMKILEYFKSLGKVSTLFFSDIAG